MKTNVFQPRKLDPASKSVYKTLRDSNSNASKAKHIYRYMDMETAIQCIKNENIKFCEPSAWRDKYEGWYYLADYSNITSKNLTHPKLFAFCASTKPVSEAAWNAYKSTEKGLKGICVQFVIDISKFRKQLQNEVTKRQKEFSMIVESPIKYLEEKVFKTLYISSGRFKMLFNNFKLENYLTLLSYKTTPFDYEEEIRFFCIPAGTSCRRSKKYHPNNSSRKSSYERFLKLNWRNCINSIKVTDDCSDVELDLFKDICAKKGLRVKIERFSLYENRFRGITIK